MLIDCSCSLIPFPVFFLFLPSSFLISLHPSFCCLWICQRLF
jgi:hypothetical protein